MPIDIVLSSKCYNQDEVKLYCFASQLSRFTMRSKMNILRIAFMFTGCVQLVFLVFVTASQEFVVNDYFYIFPIEQKLDMQAHPNTEVVT